MGQNFSLFELLSNYQDRKVKDYSDYLQRLQFAYIKSNPQPIAGTYSATGGFFKVNKLIDVTISDSKVDFESSDFQLANTNEFNVENIRLGNTYSYSNFSISITDSNNELNIVNLTMHFILFNTRIITSGIQKSIQFNARIIVTDNNIIFQNSGDIIESEQVIDWMNNIISLGNYYMNYTINNISLVINQYIYETIPSRTNKISMPDINITFNKNVQGTTDNTLNINLNFELINSTLTSFDNKYKFSYKENNISYSSEGNLIIPGDIVCDINGKNSNSFFDIKVNSYNKFIIKEGNLITTNNPQPKISGLLYNQSKIPPIVFYDSDSNQVLLSSNSKPPYGLNNATFDSNFKLNVANSYNIANGKIKECNGKINKAVIIGNKIKVASENTIDFTYIYNDDIGTGIYNFINTGKLTVNTLTLDSYETKYFTCEELFSGSDYDPKTSRAYIKNQTNNILFAQEPNSLDGKTYIALMYNPIFEMFRLYIVKDAQTSANEFFYLIPIINKQYDANEMEYENLFDKYIRVNTGTNQTRDKSIDTYVEYFKKRYKIPNNEASTLSNYLKSNEQTIRNKGFDYLRNYKINVGFFAMEYNQRIIENNVSKDIQKYKVFSDLISDSEWNLGNIFSFMKSKQPVLSKQKSGLLQKSVMTYDFSLNPLEFVSRIQLDYCDRIAAVTDTMYPVNNNGVKRDEFCVHSLSKLSINSIKDNNKTIEDVDQFTTKTYIKYSAYSEMFTGIYGGITSEADNNKDKGYVKINAYDSAYDIDYIEAKIVKINIGKTQTKNINVTLRDYINYAYVNCVPLSIALPMFIPLDSKYIVKVDDQFQIEKTQVDTTVWSNKKYIPWNTANYRINDNGKIGDGSYISIRSVVLTGGNNIFINKSYYETKVGLNETEFKNCDVINSIYGDGFQVNNRTNLKIRATDINTPNEFVAIQGNTRKSPQRFHQHIIYNSNGLVVDKTYNSCFISIPNMVWNNISDTIKILSRGPSRQLKVDDYNVNLLFKTTDTFRNLVKKINFNGLLEKSSIKDLSTKILISFIANIIPDLITLGTNQILGLVDRNLGPTFLESYGNQNITNTGLSYNSVKIFNKINSQIITFYFYVN